jgi:hypothetical protein
MAALKFFDFTPDGLIRKSAFKRAIPHDEAGLMAKRPSGNAGAQDITLTQGNMRYSLMSQADFLREFDVNSHAINSLEHYPDTLSKSDDSKMRIKVRTRVAIGFQERILTKRLVALVGNNVNLRIVRSGGTVQKAQDSLTAFREGWEDKDIEIAIHEAITSDGKTGDCAVCFYMNGGRVGWRTFGYDKGDILYPHYDPITGELAVFARLYSRPDDKGDSVTFLDVWDDTYYVRYRRDDTKDPKDGSQWTMDSYPQPHNYGMCPVAYHRYGGPFWTPSQSLIDQYEIAISQFAENNSAYALRILYTMGEVMHVKANFDGTPIRIDSPNADAKVGFLEPADSSASFKEELDTLEKNIMRSSFAVETPEIKSGSDISSLTVKMLFADSYLKALEDAQNYQLFINRIVRLFKHGYAVETNKIAEENNYNVKAELLPFVFMSESEVINAIVQLVSVGAMSKETATELAYNSGYGTVDEWNRIITEAHDELVGTQQQSASQTQTQDLNDITAAREASA